MSFNIFYKSLLYIFYTVDNMFLKVRIYNDNDLFKYLCVAGISASYCALINLAKENL